MKRITLMTTIACLLAVIAAAAFAQTRKIAPSRVSTKSSYQEPLDNEIRNLAAMLKQLYLEMGKLKSELYELQLDNQQLKIAQLERELQQVQADKLQLVIEESDLNQEIADLETALSEPTLEAEERMKMETAKSLEGSRLGEAQTEQQRLAQREVDLKRRLEQEQRRLQKLFEKAGNMKVEK